MSHLDCVQCGSSHFIKDQVAGEVICEECGLVVSRIIDFSFELHSGGDQDNLGADKSRSSYKSGTVLAMEENMTFLQGGPADQRKLNTKVYMNSIHGKEALRVQEYQALMKNICGRLRVTDTTCARATEIFITHMKYEDAIGLGSLRFKKPRLSCAAAAIYLSGCMHGCVRTLTEVAEAVDIDTKNVHKWNTLLTSQQGLGGKVPPIKAGHLIIRFANMMQSPDLTKTDSHNLLVDMCNAVDKKGVLEGQPASIIAAAVLVYVAASVAAGAIDKLRLNRDSSINSSNRSRSRVGMLKRKSPSASCASSAIRGSPLLIEDDVDTALYKLGWDISSVATATRCNAPRIRTTFIDLRKLSTLVLPPTRSLPSYLNVGAVPKVLSIAKAATKAISKSSVWDRYVTSSSSSSSKQASIELDSNVDHSIFSTSTGAGSPDGGSSVRSKRRNTTGSASATANETPLASSMGKGANVTVTASKGASVATAVNKSSSSFSANKKRSAPVDRDRDRDMAITDKDVHVVNTFPVRPARDPVVAAKAAAAEAAAIAAAAQESRERLDPAVRVLYNHRIENWTIADVRTWLEGVLEASVPASTSDSASSVGQGQGEAAARLMESLLSFAGTEAAGSKGKRSVAPSSSTSRIGISIPRTIMHPPTHASKEPGQGFQLLVFQARHLLGNGTIISEALRRRLTYETKLKSCMKNRSREAARIVFESRPARALFTRPI